MNTESPRFCAHRPGASFARTRGARTVLLMLSASLLAASAQAVETISPPKPADLTELPLETLMQMDVPIVSTASKFEQKATEAPASVTVVSAEEIQRYGYRTLADLLASVQGFYVSYDRDH